MTINELREKRNTAWENTKDFLETHRMENGLISAADAKTYDKMVQDIQSYGEEIERLEQLQSMEDTLRSSVEAWMTQADETTLECLREGREAVGIAAAEILTESEESKALLADAGNPNKYETYHPEKYDEVVLVLHELLDGDSNN